MDKARQVTAIFIGLLIIPALILSAKWTGDRIRDKFLPAKKTPVVNVQTTPTPAPKLSPKPENKPTKVATISAIPATGPADLGYALIGFVFAGGLLVRRLSRIHTL